MKSTPEQTKARNDLKLLVHMLETDALKSSPVVAPSAIARRSKDAKTEIYFTLQHPTKAIAAKETGGVILLKFGRALVRGKLYANHNWYPRYAATKPESVAELIPVLKEEIVRLRIASRSANADRK